MKRRELRFIHTSDVHLDSTSSKDEVAGYRNVAEHAFAQVVDAVIQEAVDVFLIVGDLFDHSRIKTRDFEFVQEQLGRVPCPVVLIPGNHDVHDDNSVWFKYNPTDLGSHVHPIMNHDGSLIEFPELQVTFWGKAMDEHSPEFEPLAGITSQNSDHWFVGLAHGQVVTNRADGSSSQITHDDIASSGLDYLALGHVHVWDIFEFDRVTACYSGSPVAAFASSRGGFYASVTLNSDTGIEIQKSKLQSAIKAPEVTHGVFF